MSTASTNMLQLPVATGLDGAEYFWVVQGGTDKRAQVGLIPSASTNLVTRYITAAGDVTVANNDSQIFMTQLTPQAVDVIIPLAEDKIGNVYVSDALGVSSTFNFRLIVAGGVQIISGLPSYLLNNNYMSVMLRPVPGVGYVL